MAQHVRVAVIGTYAKVQGLRTVPLIIDSLNEKHRVSEPKLDWPLIRSIACIRFNTKLHDIMVALSASAYRIRPA
jgi:hypothetical protein